MSAEWRTRQNGRPGISAAKDQKCSGQYGDSDENGTNSSKMTSGPQAPQLLQKLAKLPRMATIRGTHKHQKCNSFQRAPEQL